MSEQDVLQVGDMVVIVPLRREGVLEAAKKNGRCQVRVGDRVVSCLLGDLKPALAKKGKKQQKARPQSTLVQQAKRRKKVLCLDLHGVTTAEASARLEEAINRAVLDNYEKVQVIHGIGSGKVKRAVELTLSSLKVVKRFYLDSTNCGQTWVELGE